MYTFEQEMDLRAAIGESITQFRVGQFDLQFSIGEVNFSVTSPVKLFRDKECIATWQENKWPTPNFIDILNNEVINIDIVREDLMVIRFSNKIEMHLIDNSTAYESLTISTNNELYII